MRKDLEEKMAAAKVLEGRMINAINYYIPMSVVDYVEDYRRDPQALLKLFFTLKSWANPHGNFIGGVTDPEVLDGYFHELLAHIAQPSKLLNTELPDTDVDEMRDLIRIKLDYLANEMLAKYKLSHLYREGVINTDLADAWWITKTKEERQDINQQYEQLNEEQKNQLNKIVDKNFPEHNHQSLFTSYCMCNNAAMLHALALTDINRLTTTGLRVKGVGQDDKALAFGMIGAGILFLIMASIAAPIYGVIRNFKALHNVFSDRKKLRSLSTLGIGFAVSAIGAVKGAALGAAIGSVVPGLGTAVGAALGAIIGSGVGATVGAVISKYGAKLISAIFNRGEINPPHPQKYKLTDKQKSDIQDKGLNLIAIHRMLKAIKKEKNRFGMLSFITFFLPFARREKKALNILLEKIKNGKVSEPTPIGGQTYHPTANFNGNINLSSTAQIQRQIPNEDKPQDLDSRKSALISAYTASTSRSPFNDIALEEEIAPATMRPGRNH